MKYLDARRLPGPNVFWDLPGAVLDVHCESREIKPAIEFCRAALRRMLDELGWNDEKITDLSLVGGFSIAFSAPIDCLYSASEVSEWLWTVCEHEFRDGPAIDFADSVHALAQSIEEERNEPLLELQQGAQERAAAFLWDDDEVSLGHGSNSDCWPFRELPAVADVDWSKYASVPVGIVTGTNGKTTTVRIAKHLFQAARNTVGLSCTDWVSVNDEIVDRDDWSGPGGARLVLRQSGIDVAILETARGGLLRRGLGVEMAEAALITNIAEDHLGDFGSQSLDELLNIKWVVSHAVRNGGSLILNADDQRLVDKAAGYRGHVIWFSLREGNAMVREHVDAGGRAFVLADGNLVMQDAERCETLCSVSDMPITLGGAAMHNVANALGAAALAHRLGLSLADIAAGLCSMQQDANPGRSNLYSRGGHQVLVDFAHNPEAMQALFDMAGAIDASRRVLCFGQAGDRTDEQIRQLASSAWAMGLDRIIVSELADYARGREHGEVFSIIKKQLLSLGAREQQIEHFETERESFETALNWARDGDLVVLLDLGRESDVHSLVYQLP